VVFVTIYFHTVILGDLLCPDLGICLVEMSQFRRVSKTLSERIPSW